MQKQFLMSVSSVGTRWSLRGHTDYRAPVSTLSMITSLTKRIYIPIIHIKTLTTLLLGLCKIYLTVVYPLPDYFL